MLSTMYSAFQPPRLRSRASRLRPPRSTPPQRRSPRTCRPLPICTPTEPIGGATPPPPPPPDYPPPAPAPAPATPRRPSTTRIECDITGKRRGVRSSDRAAAAPIGFHPARDRSDRHPRGMRERRLRRLHGLARWLGDALLLHARGAGRRPQRRNRRVARPREQPKPVAARLLGKARPAMRILYARNADADDRAAARKSQPRPGNHPAAPQRQYLPLHRLREHHQLCRARGRIDARGKGSALMAEAGKIHSPPAGRQQERADQRLNVIGTRILRKEDPRFLVGRGRFVDDVALPNMAHAAVLRSPHAHARIKSIDKRAALALPGV